jgi:hypothetical protein
MASALRRAHVRKEFHSAMWLTGRVENQRVVAMQFETGVEGGQSPFIGEKTSSRNDAGQRPDRRAVPAPADGRDVTPNSAPKKSPVFDSARSGRSGLTSSTWNCRDDLAAEHESRYWLGDCSPCGGKTMEVNL